MDVHNYTERLEHYLELIEADKNISKENKDLLKEFKDELLNGFVLGKKVSIGRTYKYLWICKVLMERMKTSIKLMKTDDLKKLIMDLEKEKANEWNASTMAECRLTLKKFLQWFNKAYETKFDYSWLRYGNPTKGSKLPEEILTEEEVLRLLDYCNNLRDKTLIYVLYESGCRIGEILSLKIKNVEFDEYGALLLVNGKTGQRRVRIINSAPMLKSHIENHPFKNDVERFLWLTEFNQYGNERYESLGYKGVQSLMRKLQKRSGTKKRIHPHAFRHARATKLANVLTEAQMKEFFGWTQSSDMASIYVHLSGRDVDASLLSAYGIETKTNNKLDMGIVKCLKCGEKNSSTLKFCTKCEFPLDGRFLAQTDDIEDLLIDFFKALGEVFPPAKEKFIEVAKKRGMLDLFLADK